MASDCIFCRIVSGELPADIVTRTDELVAFRDITPVAPVHVLVVPTQHVASVADLTDPELGAQLLRTAVAVARSEGVGESGYRIVINSGADAGQSVHHLHLHVLGGRRLQWPPG